MTEVKYRSTRGTSNQPLLSFKEAVLQGLAPDGGLYIPTEVPHFSLAQISQWRSLPFAKLAFQLYRPFIGTDEIPDKDLQDICTRSFATFSHPETTPTRRLPRPNSGGGDSDQLNNLWILELFHGPTFAFKDVALQFLGNVFEYFLKDESVHPSGRKGITVLGATSGDTGGAAIYGLRGKANIDVFILHPHKRVSRIQEAQMTSVLDSNVHNIAVEGSFDDCQDIVKALFSDREFKEEYRLGAINSINWARILAQTTYYFFSYFSVLKQIGAPMDVPSYLENVHIQYSVPSGNFGDVLAGVYAKQMGLPIQKFIVATNENDILDRFLKTGRYDKQVPTAECKDPVKQTLSPAMDILISSNFERLLWYICMNDNNNEAFNIKPNDAEAEKACNIIHGYMDDLKSKNGFSVSPAALEKAQKLLTSHRVDDAATSDAITRYYHGQFSMRIEEHGDGDSGSFYILDPHTAVGVVAAEHVLHSQKKETPMAGNQLHTVCLSTASPGKFPEAVLGAINDQAPSNSAAGGFKKLVYSDIAPQALVDLDNLPQRMTVVASPGGDKKRAMEGVRITIINTLKNTY